MFIFGLLINFIDSGRYALTSILFIKILEKPLVIAKDNKIGESIRRDLPMKTIGAN